MSDDVKFYDQKLWSLFDISKTGNNLDMKLMVAKDLYGSSTMKLYIEIANRKSRISNNISLSHQHLFKYLLIMKPHLENGKLAAIRKKIKNHETTTATYIFPGKKKKYFYTMFHNTIEHGETITLVISYRGEDYHDGEKYSMTLFDYLSMIKIMTSIRDDYVAISTNFMNQIKMDSVVTSMVTLSRRIDMISQERNDRNDVNFSDPFPETATDTTVEPFNVQSFIEDDEEKIDTKSQNDFAAFAEKELETIDINVKPNEKSIENSKKRDGDICTTLSDNFTEKILKNNFTNLDNMLMAISTQKDIYGTFLKNISGEDLSINDSKKKYFPDCSNEQFKSIMYSGSLYLKTVLHNHLQDQKPIPSLFPFVYNSVVEDYIKKFEDNIKISDDFMELPVILYTYISYYSLASNQLKEKSNISTISHELQLFILKTLSAPIVFSHFNDVDSDRFSEAVSSKYEIYKQKGIFKEFEQNILDKFGRTITVTSEGINKLCSISVDAIQKRWDDVQIESFMTHMKKVGIISMNHDEFIQHDIKNEDLYKCSVIEMMKKTDGVDDSRLASLEIDTLPTDLLKKYELIKKQFDNTNLTRYVVDIMKDESKDDTNHACSAILCVRDSFLDLTLDVDWNRLPDNVAKAVWLWKPKDDVKITKNFMYFRDLVNESPLTKDMVVSMMKDKEMQDILVEDYNGVMEIDLGKV